MTDDADIAAPIRALQRATPPVDLAPLEPWLHRVEIATLRRDLPENAAIVTVLFGPTGVGKSTVFNQIVGQEIARPGAIRPTTSVPLAVGSTDALRSFREDRAITGAIEEHAVDDLGPEFRDQVVIDTPDFDSIDDTNRDRAMELFERADRIVIVLSPEKYGDQSVWSVIDAVRDYGSIAATIFNKSQGGDALEDCRRMCAERGLPTPIELPRRDTTGPDATIADATGPNSLTDEERTALRGSVLWSGSSATLLADRLESALESERKLRETDAAPFLRDVSSALTTVEDALRDWREDLTLRARSSVELEANTALRRDLEARVLEQVQKIDPLRVPRQWLLAPFRMLMGGESKDAAKDARSTDWLVPVYRDRFTEFVLDTTRALRTIAERATELTRPPLEWPVVPDDSAETIDGWLSDVLERFSKDVRQESDELTRGLPLRGKLQFYGTQAVFHTLVAGVCVKTAGLTGAEVVAQGLAAPVVAKAVGGVVSNQETRVIENRLRARFAELVADAVRPRADALEQTVKTMRETLPSFDAWTERADRWEQSFRGRLR